LNNIVKLHNNRALEFTISKIFFWYINKYFGIIFFIDTQIKDN